MSMRIDKWFSNRKFIADKIIIIGAPGSGKTFLTERLSHYFDGPVFHVDQILWKDEKIPLSDEELDAKIKAIKKEKKWFIDGTYLRVLKDRISKAELIMYLDLPIEECICGIEIRRQSTNIVHGCEDYEGFISYVKEYNIVNKPQIEKMISMYSKADVIRFNSRRQVNAFISDVDTII